MGPKLYSRVILSLSMRARMGDEAGGAALMDGVTAWPARHCITDCC